MNFDSTGGLPATRVTDIAFSFPVGATTIGLEFRAVEVLRDKLGNEKWIGDTARVLRGEIEVAALGETVALHDVKTGAALGQSLPKAIILAAVNALCRQILEAGTS